MFYTLLFFFFFTSPVTLILLSFIYWLHKKKESYYPDKSALTTEPFFMLGVKYFSSAIFPNKAVQETTHRAKTEQWRDKPMMLNIHQTRFVFVERLSGSQPGSSPAFAPDNFNETLGNFPAVFVPKYDLSLILILILNPYQVAFVSKPKHAIRTVLSQHAIESLT